VQSEQRDARRRSAGPGHRRPCMPCLRSIYGVNVSQRRGGPGLSFNLANDVTDYDLTTSESRDETGFFGRRRLAGLAIRRLVSTAIGVRHAYER